MISEALNASPGTHVRLQIQEVGDPPDDDLFGFIG